MEEIHNHQSHHDSSLVTYRMGDAITHHCLHGYYLLNKLSETLV